MQILPSIKDIRTAAERIAPYVHHTPVLTSQGLNALSSGELFFKAENLQKVGAFKARGATNAVFLLDNAQAANGVATHSSGNHGAALALAARSRGIPAYIVMPSNAPSVKQAAVAGYGAQITFCEPTLAAREATLDTVVAQTGAAFIHPYNDIRVIAGQGTAALELLTDIPNLDIVLTPVGGGGLTSGTALAVKGLSPGTKVIAVEPELADDAYRSWQAGRLIPLQKTSTIADGLRTSLGDKTFAIIQAHVDEIVTVTEAEIVAAMRMIWQRLKVVVEPSGAVPFAAVLAGRVNVSGARVGLILSGGNVDLDALPWMMDGV